MSIAKPGSKVKTSPKAVLKTLPEECQAELYAWLEADASRTLQQGLDYATEKWGVKVNVDKMSIWRSWYRMKKDINDSAGGVHAIKELLSNRDLMLDPSHVNAMATALFLAKAAEEQNSQMFVKIAAVVQRAQEVDQADRFHSDKMKLAEKRLLLARDEMQRKNSELELKVREYERKVKETKDDSENPNLTEQQRHQRMVARFGLSPSTHETNEPPERGA